ncbi:MAG: hypothetical protein RIR12_2219 [Bacteroidota bacterium]|jgi:hypothetical protein
MLIAIDETGDFSPESEKASFFVAALFEQQNNGIKIKQKQFIEWFNGIPVEKINKDGEIKGSDLTDDELLDFVQKVYNQDPVLRCEVVCFLPSENPETLVQKFKEIEVKRIYRMSEIAKRKGNVELSKQFEKMAVWHKNAKKMHYPHFIKLVILRNIIAKAFHKAIGVSILLELLNDNNSENLLNLEIIIDQDFIRGNDPTIFWKELLRTYFITKTKQNPLPALDTWKEKGHPFLTKHKNEKDGILNFNDFFKNKCNFVESHKHFEVQIADIIAIIINRTHNRQKAIKAYEELWKIIKRPDFKRIIFNPNFNDSGLEPEIQD